MKILCRPHFLSRKRRFMEAFMELWYFFRGIGKTEKRCRMTADMYYDGVRMFAESHFEKMDNTYCNSTCAKLHGSPFIPLKVKRTWKKSTPKMGSEFNSMNSWIQIFISVQFSRKGIFSPKQYYGLTQTLTDTNHHTMQTPLARPEKLTNVLSIRSPDFLLRISNELGHQRSHEKSDAQKIFDTRNSKHFFKLKKGILYWCINDEFENISIVYK